MDREVTDSQGRCKLDRPIVWTRELVRILEASKDKIIYLVDHWLDQIIGGFIIDFTVILQSAIARKNDVSSKCREVSMLNI